MNEVMLKKIHKHCFCNKNELLKVNKCGCFYCLKIFNPNEIDEWIKDEKGEETAFCPYCHIDSVIAESDEYELNEELLKEMYNYWM